MKRAREILWCCLCGEVQGDAEEVAEPQSPSVNRGGQQNKLGHLAAPVSAVRSKTSQGSPKVFCSEPSIALPLVRFMPLTSKLLTPVTWPAFAHLVEKHNGIFGGCWCISFHLEPGERRHGAAAYKAMKKTLVKQGRAHAALVFDGPNAVGWCQFGPTAELPNIRSKKAYEEGLGELPDWRITCFFIDRERRGEGIASLALREALQEIMRLGGGTVEAYPEDYTGQKVSSSFLCSGTLGMFEKAGFEKSRKIAMHRWVVNRRLPSKRASRAAS